MFTYAYPEMMSVDDYNTPTSARHPRPVEEGESWWSHLTDANVIASLPSFAIFYKSNAEGINFWIMLKYVLRLYIMCMFCIVFNLC